MARISLIVATALLLAPAAWAGVSMEPVKPTPVAVDADLGKRLYQRHCEQCHGGEGQGDGPAADRVYPRPRDFTLALYKIRSTLSGQVPTDHDLFRAISEGLPGTSMPAWKKYLTDAERWQLVHHVKTFDTVGAFVEEPAKEQVAIGVVPKPTAEMIERGKRIYHDKKCWQCHGPLGRGDGPSAEGMKDDWGQPIRPVNFTKSWRFRGGDRLEDIYRTFTTGFNGTPMPSFLTSIPETEDRWALAAFVKSLAQPARLSQVARARFVDGPIPDLADHAVWAAAEEIDVPLAGQIVVEPRWFMPAHDVIGVRAVYNAAEVAVMLTWDDGTQSAGQGGKPVDRVAVQMPLGDAARLDGEKPYFLMGDRKHGVDLWRWGAGGKVERLRAFGPDRAEPTATEGLIGAGSYKDGQYRVIFRRPLADKAGSVIKPGQFLPVAFQLWDGGQGEDGLKGAISAWYDLLLVPPTPITVWLWPGLAGIAALGGELWLARRMRRRARGRAP